MKKIIEKETFNESLIITDQTTNLILKDVNIHGSLIIYGNFLKVTLINVKLGNDFLCCAFIEKLSVTNFSCKNFCVNGTLEDEYEDTNDNEIGKLTVEKLTIEEEFVCFKLINELFINEFSCKYFYILGCINKLTIEKSTIELDFESRAVILELYTKDFSCNFFKIDNSIDKLTLENTTITNELVVELEKDKKITEMHLKDSNCKQFRINGYIEKLLFRNKTFQIY